MKEKIVKFQKSNIKNKKYKALIKDKTTGKIRTIHFGDKRYEQYKDSTPLKIYSRKNHGDRQRQFNYFRRHSGVGNRKEAIMKEKRKSLGKYNPKILSHIYLW
jgi:hypothetical protein